MNKRELKKEVKNRLSKLEYKTLEQTFSIDVKEQAVLVKALWNDSSSVYEIYINFKLEYATRQLLSSVAIHEPTEMRYIF